MVFSESNQPWQPVPKWVDFLIKLGFGWPSGAARVRRISLISMPCDSPAAGLISLGVMLRDLGNTTANDIDAHYDALLRYAKQFLLDCHSCGLSQCDPREKRCGHSKKANGKVRSAVHARDSAIISKETIFEDRKLAWRDGSVVTWPTVSGALRWHIDGEPPTQVRENNGALADSAYTEFVPGARILPENLRRSFSGLCLAGRVTGEARTQELCASIRFRIRDVDHRLDDLLTVHGWSSSEVSRVAFFNARTERLDRTNESPALVVADGGDSFLKISGTSTFQRSDLIGVIHRTSERDRLEALGEKMTALRQWYVQDEDMLCGLPAIPHGLSISILRRRE